VFLFVATFAVYAQVHHFDFVNFDDPEYVTANSHVRAGITAANVAWAFTSGEAANWFPVTRFSHLLDSQIFGMQSGWHHLTNVLFHALAVLLLFAFLNRSTGRRWPSAWVALVFALHPLHVESVAWVAERKDSLSAFFGFLALWSYARYVERPAPRRYLLVVLAFGLGLMAKPMLVTLPFLLLLVDVWPLGRISHMSRLISTPWGGKGSPSSPSVGMSADAARMSACATENGLGRASGGSWSRIAPLLREKIPLFAMSAVAAWVTYLVQQAGGAVRSREAFPLLLRLENALVSCIVYIAKMFWPARLAVFYPYPPEVPAWQAAAAALPIAAISILVLRSVRKRPYLAVGWFWYLVTLAPVIGLVQVGAQARADRYTYIPMIGLTIMLAWGAADLLGRVPRARPAIAALAAAACAGCAALTWVQAEYWHDSRTLFQHAVDVTDGNYLAHHNLGVALAETPGGLNDAIAHYQVALQIKPGYARAHTDLGSALARLPGRLPDAMAEFRAALAIDPDLAIPHNNLGSTLAQAGRWSEAISEYEAALRIDPDYADARHNMAEAQYNLGLALAKADRPFEAIVHLEAALRLHPDYPEAHNNLGVVLSQAPGRIDEGIAHFQAALRIDPNYADAHINLGVALSQMSGRVPEAIAQLEAAERIQPDAEVRQMIGRLKTQKK
jgi:tetratricopeptide (TPR) repeat protein